MRVVMLSTLERQRVWEGLYVCEVRTLYYAHLSGSYQTNQTALAWTTLVSSSGTVAALVTTVVVLHPLVAPLLAIGVTTISSYSLLSQKGRKATDSSRLSTKWGQLGQKYEVLFGQMNSATSERLEELEKQRIELSESGHGLAFSKRLMRQSQREVKVQRGLK